VDCTAGGLQGSVKQFAEKASSHRSRLLNPSGPWRDLGNFPEFLPAIIEAIKNAPRNSGIQVACDYVGYGMFNAASMSDEYRNALIQARSRGCTVQMLVLGTEPWKQALAHVPDNDENLFERLMQEAEFRERIEAFAYRLRKLDLSPPRTWKRASHLEALVQVELIYENMLRAAGIQITIVHGPLPLYLWITKSSAIWVLCPLEPRIRFPMIWSDLLSDGKINVANPLDEHGYLSCDERTVTRFHHVWHQYKAVESRAASA